MHGRVQYPETIEPLVQFIEQTPPSEILDRTLEKLRAGVAPNTMLTASALAVVRSADLPPGHHGGPLHPLAGLHAITNLVGRLDGEDRFLPVLQHVALSNKHINDPVTSPFSLLEFAPLDPTGTDTSRAADLANDGSGETITSEGIEAAKEAFLKACSRGESNKADHIFLWLWDHVPAIEAFDLLMSVALPKNALDDHYFLFPGYLWRGLETLGTEHLKVLFRPAVRYVARFPAQRVVPEVDGLIEEHGLLTRILRQRSGDDETAKIGELGEAIRGCKVYSEIPKADRPGAGRRPVAGRRRRGAVDRRGGPVPALADRQSDGRAPAHQRQPSALPDPARRLQHEEQAADAAAVAHRAGGEVHPVPHGRHDPAGHGRGRRPAASLAGGSAGGDHPEHLHPAAHRLAQGLQPRPDARGAGGEGHGQPGAAVCRTCATTRRC